MKKNIDAAQTAIQTLSMLKFSHSNAKLGKGIWSFSLPAGHSCPFAADCLSKADRDTGKITDGPKTLFRCFAASQEALLPNLRKARWHNFDMLKATRDSSEAANLIQSSLPKKAKIIRIHVGGDFYSRAYLYAWITVATNNPKILFYAYTKSLPFWLKQLHNIPDNFKLTASFGGKRDDLIYDRNLKSAIVVFSEKEAAKQQLEIDHDDSHAYNSDESFALLLHGTQPAGTDAAKSLSALRASGWTGYSKKH